MPGSRHDDFLRCLYALQQDPRRLFADQPVFLGREDQRRHADLWQQGGVVDGLDRAHPFDVGLVWGLLDEEGAAPGS